jgi:ADP-dependent NAD(P)H-hydrate dehydratase / NAD(P)H-hydrate epimerase
VKLCTAAEMRTLEEAAARAGRPPEALMEEAGLAVAQEVWINLGAMPERKAVVLVGPGNNGGDGLVAARHLHDMGTNVMVVLLAKRGEDDANLRQLVERQVAVRDTVALDEALAGADVIVDAVLGTGRARPIEGALAAALDRVSHARSEGAGPRVFAVDLPTGVDADTGAVDRHALRADVTVALGCSKVGLHTSPGAEYAGRVEVMDIGLPKDAIDALPTELLNPRWVRARLPSRPSGANKGTFGRVLVVAGSERYAGAARLAALGALRSGAGLATLACTPRVQSLVAPEASEVTYLPLAERGGAIASEAAVDVARARDSYDALLVGPGIGQGRGQEAFVRELLCSMTEDGPPAVIDADGLNNLAKLPRWWKRVRARCVLTPHPGEHARLTRRPVDEVQRDRLSAARDAAREWRQVVVLKGAYTVVAAPDGRAGLNPYANPALASAGTGDVLAGAIAGLLAQGLEPFDAACCGVYLHAAAAEGLRADTGDAGMLAGDLLPELPRTMRELKELS